MMKALTIWQPWASLIAIGAKPYEFRGWIAPNWVVGCRIGIHAGARPVRIGEVEDLLHRLETGDGPTPCLNEDLALPFLKRVHDGLQRSPATLLSDDPFRLPLSAIVCTAIVGQPKRGDLCAAEFGAGAGNDSDRDEEFNWGWPMRDIEMVMPPAEARGAQGFWNWSGQ